MASPTPVTNELQVQHFFAKSFRATWATADNFGNEVVVDVSALTPYSTKIKVTKIIVSQSPGIETLVEFDDTNLITSDTDNDEMIAFLPIGSTSPLVLDFCGHPAGGLVYQGSGDTGDVVVTTASAASGDSLFIYLEGYVI